MLHYHFERYQLSLILSTLDILLLKDLSKAITKKAKREVLDSRCASIDKEGIPT
jgi:hypothetical protein